MMKHKFKKIFSFLIACVFSFSFVACGKSKENGGNDNENDGGNSNQQVQAVLASESGFEFSYDGNNASVVGLSLDNSDTSLTIPCEVRKDNNVYDVVSVADNAFSEQGHIVEVTLPSSVAEIGDNAFYGCGSLRTVNLPNEIEHIGVDAFKNTFFLKEIELYKRGNYKCDNGRVLTLVAPSNLATYSTWEIKTNYIAKGVFKDYVGLGDVDILVNENFNLVIDDYAFYNVITGSIDCWSNVDYIGDYAFYNACLGSFNSETLTYVGDFAFAQTSSESDDNVYLPKTVKHIGEGAFWNNSAIVSEENPYFTMFEGMLCNKEKTHIINIYDSWQSHDVVIPSCIESIGSYAYSSRDLKSNAGLTFEANSKCTSIGNYAFYDTSLESVVFPASLKTIGDYAFYSSIANKSMDVDFDINTKLTNIGNYAFCQRSVNISDNTDFVIYGSDEGLNIGDYSLGNCSQYRIFCNGEICFGEKINSDASFGRMSLMGDIVHGFAPDDYNWYYYTDGIQGRHPGNLFYKDPETEEVTLVFANDFYGSELETYTIPDGVKYIADNCFQSNQYIGEVIIPSSVEYIGDKAFYNCTNLSVVTFSDDSKCKYIGDYAFAETSVTSINMPKGIEEIGDRPFSKKKGNDDMEFVWINNLSCTADFPATLTKLGEQSLCFSISSFDENNPAYTMVNGAIYTKDMSTLVYATPGIDLVVSNKCTKFEPNAISTLNSLLFEEGSQMSEFEDFQFYKTTIGSVVLPDSIQTLSNYCFQDATIGTFNCGKCIKTIGDYAFYKAAISGELVLPKSVVKIGEYAFYNLSVSDFIFEDGETGLKSIPQYSFALFNSTAHNSLVIPEGITYIGEHAFEGARTSVFTTITIPTSVNVVADYAFYRVTDDIYFETCNNVKYIGRYAFAQSDLQVDFNQGVRFDKLEYLGDFAFEKCSGMTKFVVSSSLEYIGKNPFNWTAVYSLEYEGVSNLKYIADGAFLNMQGEFTIPKSALYIGKTIFSSSYITSVVLEDTSDWYTLDVFDGNYTGVSLGELGYYINTPEQCKNFFTQTGDNARYIIKVST